MNYSLDLYDRCYDSFDLVQTVTSAFWSYVPVECTPHTSPLIFYAHCLTFRINCKRNNLLLKIEHFRLRILIELTIIILKFSENYRTCESTQHNNNSTAISTYQLFWSPVSRIALVIANLQNKDGIWRYSWILYTCF